MENSLTYTIFLSTLSLRRATAGGEYVVLFPIGFLSTLSLRRATSAAAASSFCSWQFLSTLSLRRATLGLQLPPPSQEDFYPRSPCGERLNTPINNAFVLLFLSTLSLRRATLPGVVALLMVADVFLSTLSLRRATPPATRRTCTPAHFYPRSPCGERRCWCFAFY